MQQLPLSVVNTSAPLDDGEEPRVVWHALCDAMSVPEDKRWGTDPHRQAPPRR